MNECRASKRIQKMCSKWRKWTKRKYLNLYKYNIQYKFSFETCEQFSVRFLWSAIFFSLLIFCLHLIWNDGKKSSANDVNLQILLRCAEIEYLESSGSAKWKTMKWWREWAAMEKKQMRQPANKSNRIKL